MYYVVTDEDGSWLMAQKPTDPNTTIELETESLSEAETCLANLCSKAD